MRLCNLVVVLFVSCGLVSAESRYGQPVANLENPKTFRFLDLTNNKFVIAEKYGVLVATVVYGGPQRYFVDVAVSNRGSQTFKLVEDFVRFHKNGTAVAFLDTRVVAAELQKALDQPVAASSSKVTPATFLASAQAEQKRLNMEKERATKQEFATHIAAFAHEKQSLELAPGKTTMFTFVFESPDKDKMGFELCVYVGDDEFKYAFKK
jgi:hypothetical protein